MAVRRRTMLILLVGILLLAVADLAHSEAASAFADPAFASQWQQGEAVVPNFWGPLANARDGMQEPYQEAPSGQHLVQYFDKGRMELTSGAVTNGLLATELVTGRLQLGDATFVSKDPPAIPIAGDPDNIGPTYAVLQATGAPLLGPASKQLGTVITLTISPTGVISHDPEASDTAATRVSGYDDATSHNVPGAFADYRAIAGVLTIGYAISEPFTTSVKVAGQFKQVVVQVFERRVLTYTAANPEGFQVEMGNIGQHYYQWRYAKIVTPTGPVSTAASTSAPVVTQPPPVTPIPVPTTNSGPPPTFALPVTPPPSPKTIAAPSIPPPPPPTGTIGAGSAATILPPSGPPPSPTTSVSFPIETITAPPQPTPTP